MMSNFTKGQWVAQGINVLSQDAESMICELSELYTSYATHDPLSIDSEHWGEAMANARLIASAPLMYEAVKAFVHYNNLPPSGVVDHYAALENAIELAQAALDAGGGE